MTIFLRVIQRILFALVAVAVILVLFTALQFNLQGAGWMAILALALVLYAAARAVGWVLAGFIGGDRGTEP